VTSNLMPTLRVCASPSNGARAYGWSRPNGERYLDFTSGVRSQRAGPCASRIWSPALAEQSQKLWHVSNLYEIPESERAAARLCAASFADVVFFCNSGAEAVEGAIKCAPQISIGERRAGALSHRHLRRRIPRPGRWRRSPPAGRRNISTVSAPPSKASIKFRLPISDAVKRVVGEETAAIMIEPLMGEGGVRTVEPSFLRALRELCDEHGLLLVFDEVQSGMGRTGELFAYQRTGGQAHVMAARQSAPAVVFRSAPCWRPMRPPRV